MNFLAKSKTLVLVYRNMPQQDLSESVNIMLPPQFYTLKKETLPLKYAFQAKKIAPSLFDGLLEHSASYDYMVYREEDKWVFIAYDIKEIATFLQSKGIAAEKVGKLFFAQQALHSFDNPVLLGEKDALVTMTDVVVNIPQTALKDGLAVHKVDESFTPKTGLTLNSSFHSFLSTKQAIALATLFTVFALAFFVEGWKAGNSSGKIKAEINKLLEENPSLQSQYTRKSIAEKYKGIDSRERRKRDLIKTLAGMLFKGVKVDTFKMDEKTFMIRYLCSDAKVTKHLREIASKLGFTSVKTLTGNIVEIEEKL